MTKNSYATINIGGAEYATELATLDATGEVYGFYLLSPKREGEVYEVVPGLARFSCSCPDFVCRRRRQTPCKHIVGIRVAIAEGELPPVVEAIPQVEQEYAR